MWKDNRKEGGSNTSKGINAKFVDCRTSPGRQLRQRGSATTTEDAALLGPNTRRRYRRPCWRRSSTSRTARARSESSLSAMHPSPSETRRRRRDWFPDPASASSFPKRAKPNFPHTRTWLSGRILHASAPGSFLPLCRSGSCQTTSTGLLITALRTRSKPVLSRSTVFRPRTRVPPCGSPANIPSYPPDTRNMHDGGPSPHWACMPLEGDPDVDLNFVVDAHRIILE